MLVLHELLQQRGIDLRDYRSESVEHGVQSRMQATSSASGAAYVNVLRSAPDEWEHLLAAVVVRVTSFFRDEALFAALQERVLPRLFTSLASSSLRAWVVGCATGEEAWSLAMSLAELAHERPFEVLGSDLDVSALPVARAAHYSDASLAAVPASLRARYFDDDDSGARVNDTLRAHVTFAQHDLLGARPAPSAAVVASFPLVLCRNVLIYFDRRLQEIALQRLASVVEPAGVLVLGPVESLPPALEAQFVAEPGLESLRVFRRRVTP